MKKEFAKKPKKTLTQSGRRFVFFILGGISVLAIIYGVDAYKNQGAGFSWVSSYFSKTRLHHESANNKQLVLNKNNKEKIEEKTIHFEFYTTLPNMQISPTEKIKDKGDLIAEEIEKELAVHVKKKYKQKVSI